MDSVYENFTFENQGTNTYLVYAVGAEDTIDTLSLGMLTNNRIPGLASTVFTQMDASKFIKYNVSARISVRQFFSGPVNKKRVIGVFSGIVNAMLSAEEYMIDTNSILLDMDCIFADVSTCETVLVCLPIVEVEKNKVDLGSFFKNIVFSTQFDQTENCDYVAKIINYLNSSPVFSLRDFKNVLDSINSVPFSTTAVPQKSQPAVTSVSTSSPVINRTVQQQSATIQPNQPYQANRAYQENQVAKDSASYQNQSFQNVQFSSAFNQPQKAVNPPKPITHPPKKMQIPNQNMPNNQVSNSVSESGEKMSFFYLLQHYNKENAAAYKAQKEANKGVKPANTVPNKVNSTPFPTPQNIKTTATGIPQPKSSAKGVNRGFAVPGQAVSFPEANPTPRPTAQPVPTQPQIQKTQPYVTTSVSQPAYKAPSIPQGQSMNFGETTVLGGSNIGETTVLGAACDNVELKPYLVRAKNNEKINLNKPVFRIGKERSYVDYFIGDNAAISRSHANIITRDGEYFVVDTNSTNHTYVNGIMSPSNMETKLSNGDRVRFANEDFEFKLL